MNEQPVMVVGQLTRDLVLSIGDVPGPGGFTRVRRRQEMLGGKGANLAVALAQLGVPVSLLGVAGDDQIGARALEQAARDGIDVAPVLRRPGAATALIVELLDDRHAWRYLEDISDAVLLTEDDVAAAADRIAAATAVVLQLQQPAAAALRAARLATGPVVLDGAPSDERLRDDLVAAADVVRTDARETRLLYGPHVTDLETALPAARDVLSAGPRLLALGLDPIGNLFVWPGGHLLVPFTRAPMVDTTGAGDALTAALVTALLRGDDPPRAARFAVAAASATVGIPGGRPRLTPERLREHLALVDEALAGQPR